MRPYLKNKLKMGEGRAGIAGGMIQVVEHLPSKHEALGLISSTGEKKESSSFKRLKGNGKR
jgi:hypothetical protein